MKRKTFTLVLASLVLALSAMGQVVSKDSLAVLKKQKERLELKKELNDRKLKLAKLENSVEKETRDMNKAQENAQQSAKDNADIASRLNTDATDKSLSRKAKKAARQAKRSSKSARKASNSLESLQKDIEAERKKIADAQQKLSSMPD